MAALGSYLRRAVIYDDHDMLAINKPAGVPVHAGGHTLPHIDGAINGAIHSSQPRPTAYLVHRLDRDTSGVLLLAKTPSAARRLSKAFSNRRVEKEYWAVVTGHMERSGLIDLPIAQQSEENNLMMVSPDGKPASTRFQHLGQLNPALALMALQPKTGRTHQLRVHTAALGAPILGDPKYGPRDADPSLMLHLLAQSLTVPHPQEGSVTISAPCPPHFIQTFADNGFKLPQKTGTSQEALRF